MSLEAWLTLAVTGVAVVAMVRDWLEPALSLGGVLGILVLAGVVTPEAALRGFSSPAVAVVALLLVLSGTLEDSPWVEWLAGLVFGKARGRRGLLRSLPVVGVLSAVVSNTAVVATLIPAVRRWCRRTGEFPSKYLMPLSFAAIMGGVVTLIGTSTNLVVHGMLLELGDPGFGMLELGRVAVPAGIAGILYLAGVGYGLLPEREDTLGSVVDRSREYLARLRVLPGSSFARRPVRRLGQIRGVFVAAIERRDETLAPVNPDEIVLPGDLLTVVGFARSIAELAAGGGLTLAADQGEHRPLLGGKHRRLVEAVVSPSSPLLGQRVRDLGFRGRYDAVVLAVHRHGERLQETVGDVTLRVGDTLLLLTGADFLERWRHSRDFYLISDAGQVEETVEAGDWIEPLVLLGVVLVPLSGVAGLLQAAIAGVLVLLLLGRLRPAEIWERLDWSILVIIATAIGVGHAFVQSGLAELVGTGFMKMGLALGAVGLAAAILVATSVLTEIVTNVAAAALMFPIAVVAAESGVLELHAAAAAVALGASAAFLTPIGYQTNTMVAGAGNYSFADFVRAGLPVKVVFLAVSALFIPYAW